MKTRQVIVTDAVEHPDRRWAAKQAARFVEQVRHDSSLPSPAILLRDRDDKYGPPFDGALADRNVGVLKLKPRTPVLNAYAERWIKSVKEECLDHFVVFGKRHLDHLIHEYVEHYHAERPHQGIGNRIVLPTRASPRAGPAPPDSSTVRCRTRLGGLLRSYHHAAA